MAVFTFKTTLEYADGLCDHKRMFDIREKTKGVKAGDIVRTYILTKYDRITVSTEGFNGTPAVGKNITGVSAKKITVA